MPKRPRPLRWFSLLPVLALSLALASPVAAGPTGGTQHIPNGLSDFLGGVLPPPGFYWLNYLAYVQKTDLKFKNKSQLEGLVGKIDLDASALVEAPRFVYMTPHKILGATYGFQAIFPMYISDVEVSVGGTTNPPGHQSASGGFGDVIVNPFILAWHFTPNFHMGFGVDIAVPVGNYDKDKLATQLLSKNHWTFEPLVAISYWVPGGIDVSAKIMYDFHTKNDEYVVGGPDAFATGLRLAPGSEVTLRPGQEFHFDWGVSYAVGKEDLRLGAAGYYYTQTTDDKIGGIKLDRDFRSRIASIGPALRWWPGMGRFSLTAKYLKEFATRNEKEGQNFWINTVYKF